MFTPTIGFDRLKGGTNLVRFLGVLIVLLLLGNHAMRAEGSLKSTAEVRTTYPGQWGSGHPTGLAYSADLNLFYVLGVENSTQPTIAEATVVVLTPYEDLVDTLHLPVTISDAAHIAFDDTAHRLLLLKHDLTELVQITVDSNGALNPATETHFTIAHVGLKSAQGMAVDAEGKTLFILDSTAAQVIRVTLSEQLDQLAFDKFDLAPAGIDAQHVHGLAVNPRNRHLSVIHPGQQILYELTQSGQLVGQYDLASLGLANPLALAYASSPDLTDDPQTVHLFIVDSRLPASQPTLLHQLYLSFVAKTQGEVVDTNEAADAAEDQPQGPYGKMVEVTLAPPVIPVNAASPNLTLPLVQTTLTSQYNPPSPDPSGVAYLPASGTLLIADGEVDEMSIFAGDNLFMASLAGSLVDSLTTLPFSDEPVGADVNPNNNHLFLSDDTGTRSVYEVNPGSDGLYATTDDSVTSFRTSAFSSSDPEGLAYDPSGSGTLYIVDGVNREVYKVTPGANGVFDGVPSTGDDVVTHFDTLSLGLDDPEGGAFNPNTGTLYLVGKPAGTLFEVTTTGALVQTHSIAAANARKPAGLAVGPSSQNPSQMSLYVVARGVDNDSDPNENDGKMYEFSLGQPFGTANPPVANDDSASTNEDSMVTIDVAVNDSDPDGNLAPASATTTCPSPCANPAHGTLAPNGAGRFDYTPDSGFTGTDSFVYQICDTGTTPLCDTATVNITVNLVNNPPTANDDSASTNEDTAVSIEVAANDTDPDGNLNPASANATCQPGCTNPANGMLVPDGPSSFEYTPNANFNGSDSFVYQICDTIGACDTASVAIIINSVADPPVANDDSASTNEDSMVTIDVAANDSDPDGNLAPASATTTCPSLCASPANGMLAPNGAGRFNYTPNTGFTGVDSFVYQICDTSSACDTATVNIMVNLANNPPTANDDSASTNEDTLVTINVAANDTDPDGNLNLASVTTGCIPGCANPVHGTLAPNGAGRFNYTPETGFTGADSFVYQICDTSGACDTATVNITVNSVNNPPVANDDSASTNAGTLVTIDVAANDTDPDGNLNLASATTSCTPGCRNPTNGTLAPNGAGRFNYTPETGFTGADSFVYQICDTGAPPLCDTATVNITVNQAATGNFRLSLASNGTIGGVATRDEDILEFTGTGFALIFDGSAVGVGGVDLDAFHFVDADTILMSFDGPVTIGALGTVDDSDLVQFDAARFGLNNTAGSFSMYFDGSQVGLTSSDEDIDAIEVLVGGRLLVSTVGNVTVTGASGKDEDLLAFTPTSLGAVTSGTWAMYFDGSVAELGSSGEDVDGLAVATNGDLYLSTRDNFAVTGVSGGDEDIFVCKPTPAAIITRCTYAPTLFFDGSLWGFGGNDLDAIDLIESGQQSASASLLTLPAGEPGGEEADPNVEPTEEPEDDAESIEEPEDVAEPAQDQRVFLPLVNR